MKPSLLADAPRVAASFETKEHLAFCAAALAVGGAVALRDLESLVLDGASRPPVWVLRQAGRPALHIPVNAEGAERLFDAFASLPGLRTGFMLARMQAPPAQPVVIWRKAGVRHPALSVH